MIHVENLTKSFRDLRRGQVRAVDGVSFDAQPGEVFGLLGPNGAGKTTIMRILCTVLKPTSGLATLAGYDVFTQPEQVRQPIGFLSANTGIYDRMSAWEMVEYFAKLYGLAGDNLSQRMETVFASLQMNDFRDVLGARMSTGMRQKVSIARAIVHDPPVMIFDEPTIGLDVLVARAVLENIERLKAEGKCILYSTHIMREVEKLCDRVAVISKGRIQAIGKLDELRQLHGENDLEELFFGWFREGRSVEHLYYLIIDGEKCGPYRKDELLDAGMDGDTLVWYAGRDGWIRADKLVLFDELLKQERKAIKRKRKVQRKIAQLPDPEKLRKWSRTAIMINMPAGALYVVGTAFLIAATIVYIVGGSGGPNDPPSRMLTLVIWVLFVAGLLATVVGMVLIGIELGLMAAFTWSCRRVVRVLSPRGDKAQIEVHSLIQDVFDIGGDLTGGVDFSAWIPFMVMFVLLGGPVLVLCLVTGIFLAFAVLFLIVAGVLGVFAAVFLVPYVPLAFSIYRLGFGLNRIVNDCKIEAPWAPVVLAFWVALCGMLLLLGPLSVPFFVLAPIWLQKTTATVVAICEQSIDAVEGPLAPAVSTAPPPAANQQPGWNESMR